MTTEQVKVQISADGSKVGPEINKVKHELSGLGSSTDALAKGFKVAGAALAAAFSVRAIAGFLGDANRAADQLADLSTRLNASAGSLQVLQLAAQQAGGSADSMSTALAKMGDTLGDAIGGNKTAAAALDRLGLSASQLVNLKTDEAFTAISSSLSSIPNDFERASIAQDIFGKGAKELAGLFADAPGQIDEVSRKLEQYGAKLNNLEVYKIGVINDDLQFQSQLVQNLGIRFVSDLSPAVSVAIDSFQNLLGSVSGVSKAGAFFGTVMTGAIKTIEAAVQGLIGWFEFWRGVGATVFGALSAGASSVLATFATAADALGLGMAPALQRASDAAAGWAQQFKIGADAAFASANRAKDAAIQAGLDVFRAGEIFEQKAAELEARAAAASDRLKGGQGAAVALGNTAAAPGDEIGLTSKQLGGAFAQVDALKVADVETDYRLVADRLLYDAKLIAQDEYEQTALGKLDAFNSSWLGSLLTANELAISAEEAKNMTLGGLMGDLVSMGIQQGGAMGKAGKALAIAQTVWSTGTAIMKTMASVPYPMNIAAAALVAAKGAAQLANIKKTNIGSAGSVVGAGGGSAGTSAIAESVPTGTQPSSTESQQKSAINIYIQGNLVETESTARWLQEIFQDATERDMVFFNSNSRQAMELAGA